MDADTRAVMALWDWKPPYKLQDLAEMEEWRGLVFHIAAAIRAAEQEAVAQERADILRELRIARDRHDNSFVYNAALDRAEYDRLSAISDGLGRAHGIVYLRQQADQP